MSPSPNNKPEIGSGFDTTSNILSTTQKSNRKVLTVGGKAVSGQRLNVYGKKPEKISQYQVRLAGMAPG